MGSQENSEAIIIVGLMTRAEMMGYQIVMKEDKGNIWIEINGICFSCTSHGVIKIILAHLVLNEEAENIQVSDQQRRSRQERVRQAIQARRPGTCHVDLPVQEGCKDRFAQRSNVGLMDRIFA